MNEHPEPANQAYILARYTENCEQARQHETLRERTTSMVFQTSGVMLGLLGFKEGSWQDNPISLIIAVFILLLGTWGLVSAIMSEWNILKHRKRIDTIRARLEPGLEPEPRRDGRSGCGLASTRGSLFSVWFCWRSS